ncbi:hypothetical protein [Microvirga ossetica]|nr:hypothetical protein [Microvirga ossetica]
MSPKLGGGPPGKKPIKKWVIPACGKDHDLFGIVPVKEEKDEEGWD